MPDMGGRSALPNHGQGFVNPLLNLDGTTDEEQCV
jgi:hypothetical protein